MAAQDSAFTKFWKLGYKNLVPVVPPDAQVSPASSLAKRPGARGKAVGIKGRDGLWRGYDWLRAEPATEQDLSSWAAMGAGVGIRTGQGIVALDIDTLDEATAQRAEDLAHAVFGTSAAPVRFGRWPKRLLVLRVTEPVPYQRIEFQGADGKNERIELLSDERQFVADGIHATTGKPYAWRAGDVTPLADVPLVTQAQIDAYFAALAAQLPAAVRAEHKTAADRGNINQETLTGDIEHVRNAVAALPNNSKLFPAYDDYIRIGAAIKGATQNDPAAGLDLFLSWALRWEDGANSPEVAAADFRRIKPPYELGARYLYDMAAMHSGGTYTGAEAWFQPIEDADDPFSVAERANQASSVTSTNTKTYKFLSFAEAGALALKDGAKPLIKGLLDQGAMTILYGESNVGKTFVAMDIAFHIALGKPYAGLRVTQQPVVYVAAEGGSGVRKRIAALIEHYGQGVTSAPLLVLTTPVNLLKEDADLKPLIAAMQAMEPKPGLIVLDTLSRVLAGGDENSSTDMGALVKHFDILRSALGAHLLAVHHTGKDRARGARGHSLLRAATDTEIEVADNVIGVTKQRDLDKSFESGFTLAPVVLGMDADGDPVSSCVVQLCSVSETVAVQGRMTPSEIIVMNTLDAMVVAGGPYAGGVPVKDLLAQIEKDGVSDMNGEQLRNYLRSMEGKALVHRPGRGLWAVRRQGQHVHFVEENDNIMSENPVNSGSEKEGQLPNRKTASVESGNANLPNVFD